MNSVMVALILRATVMLTPIVASAGTYVLYQVYVTVTTAIQNQETQIRAMQKELDDHESRLNNGRQSRLDFQAQTVVTFDKLDKKLEQIADKIEAINEAVVRVQTIVETRLPRKNAEIEDGTHQKVTNVAEEGAPGSCTGSFAVCSLLERR